MRSTRFGISLVVGLGLTTVMSAGIAASVPPSSTGSTVATPTVEGPITSGKGEISLVSSNIDLASQGYVAEEYFIGGTATAYEAAKPLGEDGRWKLAELSTAPYKTRMVVYRPEKAKDFNGTVFVEWLNVTAGFDTAALWTSVHNEVLRSGAAWIGVSAQAGGVQGGDYVIPGAAPRGVRGNDPARYGSLTHPGDLFSFDIFSQTGIAAAGDADGAKPLDGLKPKRVIAIGKSQSAFRLVSYVDAVHPRDRVYDGFLIASRHVTGAPLGATAFGLPDETVPPTALIRTDTDVPVFVVQDETDLQLFMSANARQPDTKRFRLWEIAGTAHADTYAGATGINDTGDGSAERSVLDPTALTGGPLSCVQPINSGPAFAVLSAATAHLDRWVRDGTPPPKAPRIETTGTDPPVIVRDEHGNAVGGVRTPLVDVPLTTITGNENAGGSFCSLFGNTTALDAATVAALYPTHDDYVKKFDASADKTVKAGFWLKPESENFKRAAAQLSVP
jgi:Alpha/beta hydrolase domain